MESAPRVYNAPRFSLASSHGKAIAVLHKKNSITLFGDLATHSAASLPNLPLSASTRDVQFLDNSYGWLLVSGGECGPTKLDCVTHTSLLKTEDGGQTLTPLLEHSEASHGSYPPASLIKGPRSQLNNGAVDRAPGNVDGAESDGYGGPSDAYGSLSSSELFMQAPLVDVNVNGIDTCQSLDPQSTEALWETTDNSVFGLYIGGATASATGCSSPYFDQLNTLKCQGWFFLPIWDDLQAPCAARMSQRISNFPTVDGTIAADAAISALENDGLGVTGVPYLDIEQYPRATDPGGSVSCSESVELYVNAWVAELHRLGYYAGVYANGQNLADDMTPGAIANWPDYVWIPQYPGPGLAIEPLYGIDANGYNYWIYDQRIHQVAQYIPTGYLNPSLVDTDFIDGAVTDFDFPYCPSCDVCDNTCPNYNPDDPSCQQGQTEECTWDPIYGVTCECDSADGFDCCCGACGVCPEWDDEASLFSGGPEVAAKATSREQPKEERKFHENN